jgi:hypothetical protein
MCVCYFAMLFFDTFIPKLFMLLYAAKWFSPCDDNFLF